MKEIRDLAIDDRAKDPRETVSSVVARWRAGADFPALVPELLPEWTARLPGDDPNHPLTNKAANPYPGIGPQALMRALRNDTLPQNMRQAVFLYLDQWKKLEHPDGHGRPASRPEIMKRPGWDSFHAQMQLPGTPLDRR